MSLRITFLVLLLHLTGTNELRSMPRPRKASAATMFITVYPMNFAAGPRFVIFCCGLAPFDYSHCVTRADSWLAPSQWETSLQSNAVFHWLGANIESALVTSQAPKQSYDWLPSDSTTNTESTRQPQQNKTIHNHVDILWHILYIRQIHVNSTLKNIT